MQQPPSLGAVLDPSDDVLVRLLVGFGLGICIALLLAVLLPIVLLGRLAPGALQAGGQVRQATQESAIEASGAPMSQPVEVARHYLGVPYVFGGTNPQTGLDCSGLVQLVYRQVGVGLPRTAQQQYDATVRLDRAELQPGDLVFFARTYADPRDWITHVGIYVGDGMHINAPTPGQVVSIQPVFSGFWGAHFVSGGRVRRTTANSTFFGVLAT